MAESSKTNWNIDTDIYNIVDSVKDLQKRYIEDENETTLSLGIFGFVADTESKKIQTANIMAGQLGNEMFATRAMLTKNILTHATYNGISDINAKPANMPITLCIKTSDINKYINDDDEFYIDSKCPIFVGEYEFHVDFDIQIKRIKVDESSYSYSARYITEENGIKITNRLSNIINPYIAQPIILNIDGFEYIGIQVTIRQYSIEEINDTMVSDSIIENKSYTFTFDNQIADFRIVVTDNGEETEIVPYMYGSAIEPDDKYCWYLFISDNTIRITFDSKSYIPGLNSQIYIKAYTTLGSDGNFEYINVDGTSEGLYVDMESTKYGYKNITTYMVALADSSNGSDKKSKEELQELIPKAAIARGNITTETDLNNYFNLINTDVNRLVMKKKVDNQLNRIWYGYFMLKDDKNNIIPTNTIDLKLTINDIKYIKKIDDGRYILPAGTYLRYDPVSGYAEPINEAYIPAEYSDKYFDGTYYYYATFYNTVIDLDPLYAAFYLTITNHDSYFIYEFVNEESKVQFIANRFHFQRNLISDQSEYNMTFNIIQSVITNTNALNYSETVEVNREGVITQDTIYTENLKVILVLYKNKAPYRWKECTYNAFNSSPESGLYNFGISINTDDTMDDFNDIKVDSMNEVGSTNKLYGYVGEDCEARIYILAKLPISTNLDNARRDIDTIAPGYEDYTVTNIYKAVNGIDFYRNYTNITNTKITQDTRTETVYYIEDVPCVGRHYVTSNETVNYFIEAVKERKDYIDYCLELVENSMVVDFKLFNTYGPSATFALEDKSTLIGNIDITMRFKLSLKDAADTTTKDNIIESIKKYIENLNDISDLHIPNLITDIINEYESRIYFIEFVGFNNFGPDDQHIINIEDSESSLDTVPEFINVRNTLDEETNELVPCIEITLV